MKTTLLDLQTQIESLFAVSDLLSEMTSEALRNDDIRLSESLNKENKKTLAKISELLK